MTEKLEKPFLTTIPFPVADDKDLSPNIKIFYGCIVGLSVKYGYCWASDRQLAEMMDTTERSIHNYLSRLEKKGYIKRITVNKPHKEQKDFYWKRERKIYVNGGFSNKSYDTENLCSIGTENNCTAIGTENNCSKKEEISKEITKKENIQRKTEPPNPQGGVSYSLPEKEKKDRSAKLAISEEAKELVDYTQQKVKSSNANAISLKPDQLSKERKAAQSLLMDLEKEHPSPNTSGAPPSLRDKLELAKRVVDASFDDDFWKNKITGVRYLKLKWGTLSAIVSQTRKSSLEERNRNESAEFTRRNPELYARGIISPGAASFDIRGKENSFRSVSYDDKNFWKKVEDFLKLNGYSFLKLENSQN